MEQVYLITPGEYKNKDIIKVGMHKGNTNIRINSYGKGTKIHSVRSVQDSKTIEKELIKQFKSNFKLYKGREYFEANIKETIFLFNKIVDYLTINTVTIYIKDIIKVEEIISIKIYNALENTNINYNLNENEKNNNVYKLIENFEKDIKSSNYNKILLFSKIYEYIISNNNEKDHYSELYDLYNMKSVNQKKKFRLKIKRCFEFIKNTEGMKINNPRISPSFLSKLNKSDFNSLNYL